MNRIELTIGVSREYTVKTEFNALAVPIGENSVHFASAPNNERCPFVERRGHLVQDPRFAVSGSASGLFSEQGHRIRLI